MNGTNYVELLENGNIMLKPGNAGNGKMSNGQLFSHVTLTRMGPVFLWFTQVLTGQNETGELAADGKTYRAQRTGNGDVYITEVRDGHCNGVGYAPAEIPSVLKEFESAKEKINADWDAKGT